MTDWMDRLAALDVGTVEWNAELRSHTSMRVGGPAQVLVSPGTAEQMSRLMRFIRQEGLPRLVIGNGSNMIIRDGGVPGVVIHTGKLPALFFVRGREVEAASSLPLARFVTLCLAQGLWGMEFEVGIPGNLGGALAMNAGCHGHETYQFVRSVRTVEEDGSERTWSHAETGVRYRQTVFRGRASVIVGATFELRAGTPEELAEARRMMRVYLQDRKDKQPQGQPNCGSVFKNPPGDYAGRLIEAVGGKGHRIGDAQIADKHGNFIVNLGQAHAADVLGLIAWAQLQVEARFGIRLEPEVEVVGTEL